MRVRTSPGPAPLPASLVQMPPHLATGLPSPSSAPCTTQGSSKVHTCMHAPTHPHCSASHWEPHLPGTF